MPVLHGLLQPAPGVPRPSDASAAVRHSNSAAAGSLRPQPGGHGCPAASRPAETGAHTGHHVHLRKVRPVNLVFIEEEEQVQLVQLVN